MTLKNPTYFKKEIAQLKKNLGQLERKIQKNPKTFKQFLYTTDISELAGLSSVSLLQVVYSNMSDERLKQYLGSCNRNERFEHLLAIPDNKWKALFTSDHKSAKSTSPRRGTKIAETQPALVPQSREPDAEVQRGKKKKSKPVSSDSREEDNENDNKKDIEEGSEEEDEEEDSEEEDSEEEDSEEEEEE